eukprot:TRINITY_DN2475_c0_g1_i1.p1 TRINITY_DN2475_c0_g1~~TRINITY_DN2475_c0_g1_i1.p1  ORF type:complete len:163 (-),score=29.87 TRINITY_DN2475_c0_g1_i1:120-608(-)
MIYPIIISAAICLTGGMLGGIVTRTQIKTWYSKLKKPSFTPPNAVFPIAWSSLYITMGVAAGLIYNKVGISKPLYVFGAQLLLNWAWSPLFFGLHLMDFAFFEILTLLGTIIYTTNLFYKIDTTAGSLMVPYILWVSFASLLNYSIWQLNKNTYTPIPKKKH